MPLLMLSILCLVLNFAVSVQGSQYEAGYILPMSGTASTSQFFLGPEMSSGTSCGVKAWANGVNAGTPASGEGPGFLYAGLNQLAFGANPSVTEAGGPGGACGLCYELTPVSNTSQLLDKQAMTFMIIDECPASANPSQKQAGRSSHCGQCQLGDVNDYGQPFHFDLAVDAMTKDQYDLFFTGVTGGRNWNTVVFQAKPCCSVTNPLPPIETWGCLTGCKNNEAAEVCKNIGLSGPTETMASRMPDTTMTFPVVLPTPGGTTTITAPLGGTTGTGCPSNGTSNSNGSYIVRTVTMTGNIPGPTVSYFYTVTAAAPSGSSTANSTTSKASVSTIYEFYGIRIGTVVGLMLMLLVLQ